MVREALFSILGNAVPGRAFYDVFAGTGVVGLEAVSRGATSARLIEKDPRQAADIQKYADQFGVADKVQVLKADAYRWAERWIPPGREPVNLFLSPPFPDLTEKSADFLTLVNVLLEKAPDESVLTIQAEDGFPVESLPDLPAWLETRVVDRVTRGDHEVFVCEVVGAGIRRSDFAPLLLAATPWSYGG